MIRISHGAMTRTFFLTASALLLSCGQGPTEPRANAGVTVVKALAANAVSTSIVISQVYGGGGNTGATYKNKYVELFNLGTSTISLSGWSIQYASATSTGSFAGNGVVTLSGSVAPGKYFLVQVGPTGSNGATLPVTPDLLGPTGTNPAAGAGKLIVANTTTGLACNGGSTACSPAQLAQIVDLVGYGNANFFEGTGAAPTLSATLAAFRQSGGCTDTDNNLADFTSALPAPRNSATAVHPCVVGGVPVTVTVTPGTANIFSAGTQAFSALAVDGFGNSAPTTFTWTSSDHAIATVDASGVATGVGGGTATITATSANNVAGTATLTVTAVASHAGEVVLSQIYGGGGNGGATYKNDFIEIFNRSTSPVSLAGWSVQQTSATGPMSTWNVTTLSGIIPAGGYYLIQEAAGAAGTVDLPTPDATGTISMGATNGKVLLAQTTIPFTVACPNGAVIVDIASYGSGTNCGTFTPTLSNTAAALRKSGGCAWTPNPSLDFAIGAPAPRNSASPTRSCVPGPLDHVAITGSLAVLAGATTQLAAEPLDANGNTVPGSTITWTTSDATIATVSATGLVTGVAASGNPATITATALAGGVTKSASVDVQVNNAGGINWIDVSSSSTSFPPGFQTQLFATAREQQGGTIIQATTFTFEAVDPQYATVQTVQNTGIITGVAAPTNGSKPGIRITATPTGGGTPYVVVVHPITIEQPVSAPASIYAVNDDFGDPTPASTANPLDFLIRRTQYTLSYNQSRGTPNWVSYELDARQMVAGQDRCNCFTADPLLPSDKQIFTSDYTNGGFDRGHMTRSADRTAANVDNAITFYLTNVVPQQADLNQGVWAQFENALADSARAGRAVYIITGPLFSSSHGLTFVKGEGKIAIPDSTWKVALIGPGNGGNPFTHTSVQSWDDLAGLTLMAVNMPNVSGVRNDPWAKYLTTVDRIEGSTGYNLLSLLQTGFRTALEYGDHGPAAHFTISGVQNEGTSLTFDASASTDPDLGRSDLGRTEALTYAWHFSDGSDAVGKVVTKTFADNGNYTASLTVTDAFGWPNMGSTTVAVANVAPMATFGAPGTVDEGSPIVLSLTGAADPGSADMAAGLRFAFDCGDGSGYGAAGSAPSVSCPTSRGGSRTVRGRVIDKDGGFTEYSSGVAINNVPPAPSLGLTATTIFSGESITATGSFTDPGADGPWSYLFNWGSGANTTGTLAASGASTTASRSYLIAGSYTITFTVTDADGASGSRSASLDVRRRELSAEVDPKSIKLNDNGNGDIKITLRSTTLDLRTLDLASVMIGTAGISTKGNGGYKAEVQQAEAQLHFDRKALIDAGALTPTTTEVVLVANLSSGVQVVARGAVTVH